MDVFLYLCLSGPTRPFLDPAFSKIFVGLVKPGRVLGMTPAKAGCTLLTISLSVFLGDAFLAYVRYFCC